MATDIVLQIVQVPVERLRANAFNPRKWSKDQLAALRESIIRFGLCDPLIANSASGREHFLLGGHMRLEVAKEIGLKEVPVVYIKLEDIEKERELCVRLNKNTGSFDLDLLKAFSEEMLADIGFDSAELDSIFDIDPTPEKFDLKKELEKLNIHEIKVQKGDVYEIAGSKLMCGDSTIEADMLKLMGDEKADMCFTDEPYVLDYLHGKKRNGKATTGFGLKRDRRYLETESIPDDFIEKWMANVAKVQKPDFSIIAFEHPKNLRLLWNELEKHWKYRGTIVWRLPNRMQGFSGKYKFFNKFDIAVVGSSGTVKKNVEPETEELFENEYQAALYATSGKPHWESYEKGKKYQPTDFVEFIASDAKSSGQGVIFGCKPIEILIPYIKVLTKRGDLVVEPFGGSGSTGVACFKLGRRCYTMEKVPAYTEVIKARWEKLTGQKANKIS
ncbi:MAG: ParB domain protein nuclease [Parcubacteria group bacterium GW2011_GWA1_47_11]|nr:MAG: ParB domain protein nuclease [Parcubacteria group bacterium GW2011_GWA1_47_11]